MKIIKLIKSEFLKNYSRKKVIIICLIMLTLSIIFVEVNDIFYHVGDVVTTSDFAHSVVNELKDKDNLTLEEQFNLKDSEYTIKMYNYLGKQKAKWNDYRLYIWAYEGLDVKLSENDGIDILLNNYDNPTIQLICNSENGSLNSYFQGTIYHLCTGYTKDELKKLYSENKIFINDYTNILKENKYYLYIEYKLNKGLVSDDDKEMAKYIIENKIEDGSHFTVFNYNQFKQLGINANKKIITEKEFLDNIELYKQDGLFTYKDYVRYNTYLKNEAINNKNILRYSTNHNIKHDISFNSDDQINKEILYLSPKTSVNLIFHFSIIVMIIVSITSSGIVANEHNKGTIKNIVTAPVRRWKILLSKFVYLILHSYIIWLIALIFLSLYSGIKYGFSDLFTSKLICINNNVIEVNYYLYLLKDLFIASIPVICFLSILFFLSTVTLNTSLTVGITIILSLLSPVYWFLCSVLHMNFLVYTPLLYFDTGFAHSKIQFYTDIMKQININYNLGIIISLIFAFVLYIITNIVYGKRDIKN